MRTWVRYVTLLVVVAIIAGVVWLVRQQQATKARELDDAKTEARRWVERLGGQVLNLVGTNDAAKQALADAAERYTAAGSQIDQARSAAQARGVTETAYEGLYYVRAARTAMGLDPGPELPPLPGQQRAGAVSEAREVEVEGQRYGASPDPTGRNTHYYPGGMVAGRPVPRGWYSEPWWRPALVAGAWGLGSALLFTSLFSGMSGVAYADGFADGMAARRGRRRRRRRSAATRAPTSATRGGDWGGDFGGGDFGAAGATSSDPPGRSDLSGPAARLSDRPGGTFPGRSARSGARVLRSVPTGAPTAPSTAALPAAPA